MSATITPTVGGPQPGFGIRVRKDGNRALAVADADCVCGQFSEFATGDIEVESLVRRAERHMRDECTNPHVRKAAALRDYRRRHPTSKRRK